MTAKKIQTRANGNKTKKRILDAAEALFGERGFDAVSLRDITDHAEVTLALASYHFETKQNLFEKVVGRRASPLCEIRQNRLVALPEDADIRMTLAAFLAPLFEQVKNGDDGWINYMRVLPRLGEGDRWLGILSRHFDETAGLFIDRLCQLLPATERNDVARAFNMVLQLMLATVSRNGRLDSLTNNEISANNLDAAFTALLDFTTAGVNNLRR